MLFPRYHQLGDTRKLHRCSASYHIPGSMVKRIWIIAVAFRKAFDTVNNTPLANLFVSMLQRLGIEADKFGSSTGTLTGLELSRG